MKMADLIHFTSMRKPIFAIVTLAVLFFMAQPGMAQPKAVDLGLSVKWASCNVGATSPEDYGGYYAWGETVVRKLEYSWLTYKVCTSSDGYYNAKFSKYNTSSSHGHVDNKTILELSDDVAHMKWGGSWRMPTDEEWTELRTKCTWTRTTHNGKNGFMVTSKTNGNSIFLPTAGLRIFTDLDGAGSHGCYWSSSLNTDAPENALRVVFYDDHIARDSDSRYLGQSVRPVSE